MSAETKSLPIGELLDTDLELASHIPTRPRIAHNLGLLPHGKGVAITGGSQLEILSGYGLRQRLAKLLPFLDGSRSVEEIVGSVDLSSRDCKELIANLMLTGLLRDGPLHQQPSAGVAFFDRLCGHTGVETSGKGCVDRLDQTTLGIYAPQAIASVAARAFEDNGGHAIILDQQGSQLSECNFLYCVAWAGVCEDGYVSGNVATLFDRAQQLSFPAYAVELGDDEYRLGPFIWPRRTATFACYREAFGELDGPKDRSEALFFAANGLHQLVLFISGLLGRAPFNRVLEYRRHGDRLAQKSKNLARLHAWDERGQTYPLDVKVDGTGYEAWKHYCGVALQHSQFNPPNAYHGHYKVENVMAIFQRPLTVFAEQTIALPKPQGVPLHEVRGPGVSLDNLARVLRFSIGMEMRDGQPTRFAPTGGNLGSPHMLVIAHDVQDLERGLYSYDPSRHVLEVIAGVDVDEVLQTLGSDVAADVTLVTLANTTKVARKYGPFAVNVSWYDSGVQHAFASQLAQSLSLFIEDLPCKAGQEQMLKALKLPTSGFILTGVSEVRGRRMGVVPQPTHLELVQRICERRAVRSWSSTTMSKGRLDELLGVATPILAKMPPVGGVPADVSLLMSVRLDDGPSGIYLLDRAGRLTYVAPVDQQQHRGLVSQVTLTQAPVIVFPRFDLQQLIAGYGDRGIEVAYRASGYVTGRLWLEIGQIGLAGTACGGAFEGDLRDLTGRHGLADFAPLSMCIGPAV